MASNSTRLCIVKVYFWGWLRKLSGEDEVVVKAVSVTTIEQITWGKNKEDIIVNIFKMIKIWQYALLT